MTGGLSWKVTGAILGAVIGSVVGYTVQGWTGAAVAAGVGGALGAMLGPLLVLGTLFAWYFATYRHRFIDEEWSAEQELEPGRTYEVRWFRMDGGQFAELARETFRLRRHNQ